MCFSPKVREENPHLVLGNVSIARKMGFPEVILPGDVRNDLYLTLISGEFSKGSKKSDKNVEVLVQVCNEKGEVIPVSSVIFDATVFLHSPPAVRNIPGQRRSTPE